MTERDFEDLMRGVETQSVAVGVSGGPDSMALTWLLSRWAGPRYVQVHAITVDHGLRPEAAQEAIDVGISLADWPNVNHAILRWEGDKPGTRVLEEARFARYDLIRDYMKQNAIKYLFTAHHQDDQAETFLIRLAKGSGLDGLAGMQAQQEQGGGVILCRPLLAVPKDDLIALCENEGIPYTLDPSNENEKYLRPRLRATREVLEEEGMSNKRLAVTASRLARARAALEILAQQAFDRTLKDKNEKRFVFDWTTLKKSPEDIILRILIRAVSHLHPGEEYGPRMEKLEQILARLLNDEGFKSATLGGCLFSLSGKDGTLKIEKEKP